MSEIPRSSSEGVQSPLLEFGVSMFTSHFPFIVACKEKQPSSLTLREEDLSQHNRRTGNRCMPVIKAKCLLPAICRLIRRLKSGE